MPYDARPVSGAALSRHSNRVNSAFDQLNALVGCHFFRTSGARAMICRGHGNGLLLLKCRQAGIIFGMAITSLRRRNTRHIILRHREYSASWLITALVVNRHHRRLALKNGGGIAIA